MSRIAGNIARSLRLPAEWEPQEAVQLTWPHPDTDWYELDKVIECYCAVARAIQRFTRLIIVTRDIAECKADIAGVASAGLDAPDINAVRFYEIPLNDTWARDHGGISMAGPEGEKYVYDFVFNGWGLKFHADKDNLITRKMALLGAFADDVVRIDMTPFVLEGGSIDSDGAGTLLTTHDCLASVNRNEQYDDAELEDIIKNTFGLKRILWLKDVELAGDDTDSHIDIFARFCSEDTIAYISCDDPSDVNYLPLKGMEKQLKQFRTLDGKPYNLVPLPLPEPLYLDDYRLPASYANFLITNGGVLVPGCNSPEDEVVKEILSGVFPDREVVVTDCRPLLSGHGGLHCITMNYPKGYVR